MRETSKFDRLWTFKKLVLLALIGSCFSGFALADSGNDNYKKRCAPCHGATGAGDTMIGKNQKIRSLHSVDVQKQSDEELFNIISKGRYKMPAFERKLSKNEIHDLVRHIRALK